MEDTSYNSNEEINYRTTKNLIIRRCKCLLFFCNVFNLLHLRYNKKKEKLSYKYEPNFYYKCLLHVIKFMALFNQVIFHYVRFQIIQGLPTYDYENQTLSLAVIVHVLKLLSVAKSFCMLHSRAFSKVIATITNELITINSILGPTDRDVFCEPGYVWLFRLKWLLLWLQTMLALSYVSYYPLMLLHMFIFELVYFGYQTCQLVLLSQYMKLNFMAQRTIGELESNQSVRSVSFLRSSERTVKIIVRLLKRLRSVYTLFTRTMNWFGWMLISGVVSCSFNTYLMLYCILYGDDYVLVKLLWTLETFICVLALILLNVYLMAALNDSLKREEFLLQNLIEIIFAKQCVQFADMGWQRKTDRISKEIDLFLLGQALDPLDISLSSAVTFNREFVLEFTIAAFVNALSFVQYHRSFTEDRMCVNI